MNWNVYAGALTTVVELKDKPKFGYTFGLRGILELNKKWSVVADVLYANRNFEHLYYKYSEFHNAERLNFLKGTIVSMDIPIMLRRNFSLGNHFTFYAQSGVAPSLTLKESYDHFDPERMNNLTFADNEITKMIPTEQEINFQPYIGNLVASMGLTAKVKHFNLSVEPKFQWCVHRVSMEQKRTYTAGIGVGMGYLF